MSQVMESQPGKTRVLLDLGEEHIKIIWVH
jgi:hypothetical protein